MNDSFTSFVINISPLFLMIGAKVAYDLWSERRMRRRERDDATA